MGLSEYEGVEFEDEKYIPQATVKEKGGMYGYLLSKGFVQSRTQANILLIVFLIIILIITYTISELFLGGHKNAPELTPEDSYRAGNPSEIDNSIR